MQYFSLILSYVKTFLTIVRAVLEHFGLFGFFASEDGAPEPQPKEPPPPPQKPREYVLPEQTARGQILDIVV